MRRIVWWGVSLLLVLIFSVLSPDFDGVVPGTGGHSDAAVGHGDSGDSVIVPRQVSCSIQLFILIIHGAEKQIALINSFISLSNQSIYFLSKPLTRN